MDAQLVSHCPHCRSAVRVRESQFGQPVRCPACREQFTVSSIESPFSAGDSLAAAPAALETLATNGSAPTVPASLLPPPAPQARARLGRMGRFELSRLLGQGAFGRVYLAYDPQLERYVALKVPIFGPGDKKKIQRFLAEAKAAARLRHPNIVPTYESGQIDGQYYIAAQFVPGQTLSQRLKDSPIDFRQAAEWVRQLAEALAYAHFQGIIHRDIKPENIMIDEKGVPQIMDFGLAKRVNEDAAMTTDGSVLGTPAYMAPEQARGNQVYVGPHSDQYSLGVVLYELLTGERPFTGPTHAVIEQLLGKEPPAPRSLRPEIPPDLEAICQKAMTKEISGRYASTAELAYDLACFLSGEATLARPILFLERAARWGRRNPLVAALSGALGLVVLVSITVIAALIRSDNESLIVGAKWVEAARPEPNFALELNGAHPAVTVETLLIDRTGPFTLEALVTPDRENYVAVPGVFGVNFQTGLFVQAGNRWLFGTRFEDLRLDVVGPAFRSGQPLHVACVREGKMFRLFVDGKLVAEQDGGPHPLAAPKEKFRIGSSFFGRIDEIRVSKTARYRTDFAPPRRHSVDADTQALFHCDDGKGDILQDSSGNNHHGKIVGAKWVGGQKVPGTIMWNSSTNRAVDSTGGWRTQHFPYWPSARPGNNWRSASPAR